MNRNAIEHKCRECLLSRRRFLGASAAAALAVPLVGLNPCSAFAASDLGEYIDIASLRPSPRVRIAEVVIRQKPPYWLGWPGTSYDLEKHRTEYAEAFAGMAKEVGVQLESEEKPLESSEAVEAYVKRLKSSKPDAVLVSLQHLGTWRWASMIADAGFPTIIFSPVGTAFTGHVDNISRREGVHVISSLETCAVRQAMMMVRAKRQLEETRLLVLRGTKKHETVMERLGTKISYVPRSSLQKLFAQMPENDEVYQVAKRMRRGAKKVIEPDKQDLLNSARTYTTAKRLLRNEKANALTTDCLGMVSSKVVPTPPCMAASIFQDEGVTYGCEADISGALSLMLVSYMFDKCGFMNDPVPDTVKNVLIAAHCTSGTKIDGFDKKSEPYNLRTHSESDIGVAPQVIWKEGRRATLIDFKGPNELILDTGTVVGNVNTPPAGGCRTSVELAMDRVEDVRDVLGFHQVVFAGDHRRDINAFCQLYGIKVVNSPEKSARGENS
jgi:hypothetical protein